MIIVCLPGNNGSFNRERYFRHIYGCGKNCPKRNIIVRPPVFRGKYISRTPTKAINPVPAKLVFIHEITPVVKKPSKHILADPYDHSFLAKRSLKKEPKVDITLVAKISEEVEVPAPKQLRKRVLRRHGFKRSSVRRFLPIISARRPWSHESIDKMDPRVKQLLSSEYEKRAREIEENDKSTYSE